MTTLLPAGALASVVDRAGDAVGFDRWHEQARRTGFCSHPVRLRGQSLTVNPGTGEVLSVFTSDSQPDGVLLLACGNRRATRCPSCAETYRQDSFHLVAAGLRGGKGLPDQVAAHPRVFATLTAPSFGPVHTRNDSGDVCHRRRRDDRCEHGQPRGCWRRHRDDDALLGQPICAGCFDYEAAVLWNAVAPELWRRTTIAIRRQLARLGGVPVRQLNEHVRLRFTKVIEYQARGAIHVHAVLRLDGPDPDRVSPPGCAWSTERLQEAVRRAVMAVDAPIPGKASRARWGQQLKADPLPANDSDEAAATEARRVAAYVAKYATKSTDPLGALDRRLTRGEQIDSLQVDEHRRELVDTAWRLGGRPEYGDLRLRAWAHSLGYRGHWATRSRRYSTTLAALRAARQEWRRSSQQPHELVAAWSYSGSGYRNSGDAWLAQTAQQQRLAAKQELRALARPNTKGDGHGEALANPR